MIDPDILPFLADWAAGWADLPAGADAAARRAHFEQLAERMREPMPEGVHTREQWLEGSGHRVRTRVFEPAGSAASASAAPRPALVYWHGGAWMQGSPETHWDITSRIAARTGRVVFSVAYALAPEHPFPAAINDSRVVMRALFGQATELGVDPRAIVVAGDSAGGNLAAAMALDLRGSGNFLQGQVLAYPATDFRMDRGSHRDNADGPIVTVASMPFVNRAYCPDESQWLNPLVTPLNARSHAGLPPAFIAVAEYDPLRDEGIAYAKALQDAGVPVRLDRGAGLIHGYLRAMAYSGAVRDRFSALCGWLNALPPSH